MTIDFSRIFRVIQGECGLLDIFYILYKVVKSNVYEACCCCNLGIFRKVESLEFMYKNDDRVVNMQEKLLKFYTFMIKMSIFAKEVFHIVQLSFCIFKLQSNHQIQWNKITSNMQIIREEHYFIFHIYSVYFNQCKLIGLGNYNNNKTLQHLAMHL